MAAFLPPIPASKERDYLTDRLSVASCEAALPVGIEKERLLATRNLVAVDLDAGSGRVLLIRFDGGQLSLEEVHRFVNQPVMLRGHRFWNMLGLWDDVLTGLGKATKLAGTLDSIGVDTWEVDYGLVDKQGFPLSQPFQYRDSRTNSIMEQVLSRFSREALYARTGIQFQPFNTLYRPRRRRSTSGVAGRAPCGSKAPVPIWRL
jgi:rhamnulokinase